jgi:hypothetical protein
MPAELTTLRLAYIPPTKTYLPFQTSLAGLPIQYPFLPAATM